MTSWVTGDGLDNVFGDVLEDVLQDVLEHDLLNAKCYAYGVDIKFCGMSMITYPIENIVSE